MKEKDKIIWEDKSAEYIPWLITGGFIVMWAIAFFSKDTKVSRTEITIIALLVILALQIGMRLFSPETKPLQITEKGIVLSEDKKFWRRKRKLVEFKNIKKIRICRDEKGGSRMEFLYLIDRNGNKYRNVIFEVSKFKLALGNYLKLNIKDSGPYSFLPENWR